MTTIGEDIMSFSRLRLPQVLRGAAAGTIMMKSDTGPGSIGHGVSLTQQGRRIAGAALGTRENRKPLRAGVPVTVSAEIGPRLRIVGTIGLHAVSDRIIATGRRRHRDRAAIVISVVVVARRIIARSAAVIALRGDRAADQCAGHRARDEPAAATAAAIIAATAA